MEYTQIAEGIAIPKIGLGTYDLKSDSIRNGIDAGYRLFDTAWQYGNECEVGKAVLESGIDREDIFVTTKLWTKQIRMSIVREALEESLRNLKMDYVDLYLIHWPADGFEKAWEEMNILMKEGKIKAIGVSNFNKRQLDKIANIGVSPAVNQIESHPYFRNDELIKECVNRNIKVQAWCPLGGSYSSLKTDKLFEEIAQKYDRTPAQIILRWHIQRGLMVIPRSSNIMRLKDNIHVFDFKLDEADMSKINALDTGIRMGADPDNFNF